MSRGVRLLGFGVAIEITCPELKRLRTALCIAMGGELSRQDSQGWRPHVTIQNKVDAPAARALQAALKADFAPRPVRLTGLAAWRYRGGPWEPVSRHRFGG